MSCRNTDMKDDQRHAALDAAGSVLRHLREVFDTGTLALARSCANGATLDSR